MPLTASGAAIQARVHSRAVIAPKPLLSVLVALVALCVAFPALTLAGTTRATTAHSASASTSKKKPSKKRRKSSRQSSQKAPTSDRITEIQSALSRGGYLQGDPNGKWDSTTVAAMQKFQSSNGLEANGKLDALSLQKLGLGSDIAGVSAPKPVAPHGSASLMLPSPGPSASMVPPASQALPATSSASNLHGSSSVAVSAAATQ